MSEHQPNAVLRGGPVPVGPRQVHLKDAADQVTWQAADGSGTHAWTRTGQFEEHPGGLLRVYVYAGAVGKTKGAAG